MNKQVKINIKDKDYYCDMEVLKLIERLQDKVELLEYNRDKAIEYNDYFKKSTEEQKKLGQDNSFIVSSYLSVFHDMMNDILGGEEDK